MKEQVSVDKEEYERLKRLNENVDKRIEALKTSLTVLTNKIAIQLACKDIEDLESLRE
jgi:hypothetical protein